MRLLTLPLANSLHQEARKTVTMMSKSPQPIKEYKKTEMQSADKMNVDSSKPKTPEQMNVDSLKPMEQVKAEPTPATHPSSIDRTKYAAIIDLISTEKCQSTDNWKYVNQDEFGPNEPFLQEDMIGEEGSNSLYLCKTDTGSRRSSTQHLPFQLLLAQSHLGSVRSGT
jgi:hypothetical protein